MNASDAKYIMEKLEKEKEDVEINTVMDLVFLFYKKEKMGAFLWFYFANYTKTYKEKEEQYFPCISTKEGFYNVDFSSIIHTLDKYLSLINISEKIRKRIQGFFRIKNTNEIKNSQFLLSIFNYYSFYYGSFSGKKYYDICIVKNKETENYFSIRAITFIEEHINELIGIEEREKLIEDSFNLDKFERVSFGMRTYKTTIDKLKKEGIKEIKKLEDVHF